jgi:hypothetical protein
MKYYAEYADSDVLPSEVYAAKFGEDMLFKPQDKVEYMMGKKFKFKPKETGDLFQRFLALAVIIPMRCLRPPPGCLTRPLGI